MSDEFWRGRTIDEIAAAQGVKVCSSVDELFGDWSEEDFEGFEEMVRNWRSR